MSWTKLRVGLIITSFFIIIIPVGFFYKKLSNKKMVLKNKKAKTYRIY